MMDLNFNTGSAQYENIELHGALANLDNAVLVLFWSGEKPVLGTLTVTLPDKNSSRLLGERDSQIALVIGSQVALKTGKMALVSVNLPGDISLGASKVLMGLVQNLMDILED